jgi:hypothetical protein
MKYLANSLISIGLIVAIVSIWVAKSSLARDMRAQIKAIVSSAAPQPPTTSDSRALRVAAQEARDKVSRSLSDLHSEKTEAVALAESYVNPSATPSLEEAQSKLAKLAEKVKNLKAKAVEAEDEARNAFSAYQSALDSALEDAVKNKHDRPINGLGDILGLVGGLVGVGGLLLNWRADAIERAKKELEIKQLQRELGTPTNSP